MLPHERPWDKNLQLLLVGIIAFNTVPLFTEIPPWASALTAIFLGWKSLYLWRGVQRPPRWVLYSMVVASTIGVFSTYGTIIGQEAASALLVVLTSAKLLETNRYRDAMIVIFTSYFLLMAHLLTSQSLLSTVYMATDVMLITSLMFQAHKTDRRSSIRSLRPVMRLLALAIPVWVFLFLAFPRFSTGAWNLTQMKKPGTGFSDTLNPGEVEKLAEVDEPAMRVTFRSSVVPPMEALYWRGAVLTEGDGLQWQRPRNERALRANEGVRRSDRTRSEYQVSLEPSFRTWLFLLDYPEYVTLDGKLQSLRTRERYGFIHETNRESIARLFYEGESTDLAPLQEETPESLAPLLALPENLDPRVIDLAREIRAKAETWQGSRAIADRVGDAILAWFVSQKFRYTKEPGAFDQPSGAEQLSAFLFERKRGFCEHYAAAFATLARAAGIPARVTVGFQGGKFNEFADYLLVRSLDAHAWAEIWREDPATPGRGRWTRVDPTSVIAPLRLRIGGDFNLLEESLQNATPDEYQRRVASMYERASIRVSLAWDAVQMKWNSFLNEYDFEFQKSLLSSLGFGDVPRLLLAAFSLVGVGLIVLALSFVVRRGAKKQDPLLSEWRRFCRKFEKAGLDPKGSSEGPLDFGLRAEARWPTQAEQIRAITTLYCELRYGPEAPGPVPASKKFRQSARRFSIDESSRSAAS